MFRRKYLRALRVDFSIANPDLIDPIHQLRDEIKVETGAAERGDLSLGSNNHMRVFNRVVEIISGHCASKKSSVSTPRSKSPFALQGDETTTHGRLIN